MDRAEKREDLVRARVAWVSAALDPAIQAQVLFLLKAVAAVSRPAVVGLPWTMVHIPLPVNLVDLADRLAVDPVDLADRPVVELGMEAALVG